jgi:hypothetical protein
METALDSNPCCTKGSWRQAQYCKNMKGVESETILHQKKKQNASAGRATEAMTISDQRLTLGVEVGGVGLPQTLQDDVHCSQEASICVQILGDP